MLDRLLSIFVPHSCCGCGNLGSLICQFCKNDIVSEPFSRCLVCLRPTPTGSVCNGCTKTARIDGAWCVGPRSAVLKPLLDRYKFDSALEAGTLCAELLHETVPLLPANMTVVPVPTSPGRIRVRGFDHTAVISRRFSRIRSLPYRNVLERSGSQTQHFKSRAERLKTAGASLSVKATVPEVVLLVDDIYTTGATVQACVRLLRQNGTKKVYVAIIARQTLDEANDLW